jgi:hypothetical protein
VEAPQQLQIDIRRQTTMKQSRRHWLTAITLTGIAMAIGNAWAAVPVVEIIAFAHPPVQSALKPLRDWLPRQGAKVRVIETDMETPEAERKLQAVGLTGHLPVVILINGQYKHKRPDGSSVEFVSFPAGAGAGAAAGKGWTIEDVKSVLTVLLPK